MTFSESASDRIGGADGRVVPVGTADIVSIIAVARLVSVMLSRVVQTI